MNKLRYIPGDLVYQKDDEGHWNIRSLSALNLALINYKDIKPIPLTSEILEKNGWRKTKIYYNCPFYKRKCNECRHWDEEKIECEMAILEDRKIGV